MTLFKTTNNTKKGKTDTNLFFHLTNKTEKPQRIALITPPSPFLMDERVFMHLGILKIASVLEKKGHLVEMLDLSGVKNYLEVVKDFAESTESQIFGITATTPQMPSTYNIALKIREIKRDSKLILGGPHGTLTNSAHRIEITSGINGRSTRALQKLIDVFDVIVAGDGELAIFEAIEKGAPKILDADNGSSPLFLTSNMLTELPLPARHLVDMNSYHYYIDREKASSIIAQLGCPFNCSFCGGRNSPFLRKVRMRSIQSIIHEMEHLFLSYGIKGFMLYDDELNVNPKMIDLMHAISNLQDKHGIEFRLRGFLKAELFNKEQARAMYNAGFRWILAGFESGSQRMLENMNKTASKEENLRCIELAYAYNLKIKALMSIGHPGESLDTVSETKQWLLDVKPDDFDATIITPYPGSPYYDRAKEENGVFVYYAPKTGDALYQQELDYTQTSDYYKGMPGGGYSAHVYTDYLNKKQLVIERDRLENEIRLKLKIPFNPSAPGVVYEHSMGQGTFPSNMLRKTVDDPVN